MDVGPAYVTTQEHMWTLIRVVKVRQASVHNCSAHVLGKATVVVHISFKGDELALL